MFSDNNKSLYFNITSKGKFHHSKFNNNLITSSSNLKVIMPELSIIEYGSTSFVIIDPSNILDPWPM